MNKFKILLMRTLFNLLGRLTLRHLPPLMSVGVIIEDRDCLLLIDRSDGLGFSLPGGLMKWNETPEETAVREVKEETGYHINVGDFVNLYSNPKRDPRFHCLLLVYKATISSGNERSSVEGAISWKPKSKLPKQFAFDNELIVKSYLDLTPANMMAKLPL